MAEKTRIAWTDHTFNIAWGCTKVSPACRNCYAERIAQKFGHAVFGPGKPRRTFGDEGYWKKPLAWNARAERLGIGLRPRVLCSSMADNWEDHPTIDAERAKLWPLIRATPNLDWLLLTKRIDRVWSRLPDDWGDGYPNVWLGTSVENMEYAWRADELRRIQAAVRFVSYEPALGPLDELDLAGIDWVIYGGESGPGFRRHDPAWARTMRDKCAAIGAAFFYKQSPNYRADQGIYLDGRVVRQWPGKHTETQKRGNAKTSK